MSKALELYERYDEEGEDAIGFLASETCKEYEEKTLGDVYYITYIFQDNSKLTFGDNGYLGCEG